MLTPIILLIFIFGLFFGSFLNVLIERLPKGRNVITGRSKCDYCGKTLTWQELIPLFSFIIQKGRCRKCRKKLSFQYPLMELATGAGFALIYFFVYYQQFSDLSINDTIITIQQLNNLTISLIYFLTLFSTLLVLFVADIKYQILPDSMIIIGIIITLIYLFFPFSNVTIEQFNNLLSALGASLFFLIIWAATKGRGMGFGDVKLAFLLGLMTGFPLIIIAFYIAFLTGATVGVILILVGGKKLKSKIAFGPFMIAGTVISVLCSTDLLKIWSKFL